MPVDPRHKQNLPAGRALAAVVRRFLREQARTVVPHAGWVLDLSAWDMMLAEAAEPVLLQYAARGYHQEFARIRRLRRVGRRLADFRRGIPDRGRGTARLRGRDGLATLGTAKAFRFDGGPGGWLAGLASIPRRILSAFNLPTPATVIQAVRNLALRFATSTNRTTAYRIDVARRKLREELAEGFLRGEPAKLLTARVGRIFTDPARAFVIAGTEASRAVHAGQLLADLESKVVSRHRWLASQGACEICESINGKVVPLGEPFYVHKKPGPYQHVLHPPLHANCRCVTLSVAA